MHTHAHAITHSAVSSLPFLGSYTLLLILVGRFFHVAPSHRTHTRRECAHETSARAKQKKNKTSRSSPTVPFGDVDSADADLPPSHPIDSNYHRTAGNNSARNCGSRTRRRLLHCLRVFVCVCVCACTRACVCICVDCRVPRIDKSSVRASSRRTRPFGAHANLPDTNAHTLTTQTTIIAPSRIRFGVLCAD